MGKTGEKDVRRVKKSPKRGWMYTRDVQLESVLVCPLCGSTAAERWGNRFCECYSCRVAFRPKAPDDQLAQYWKNQYWSEARIEWYMRRRSAFKHAKRVLEKYMPGKGIVLDIGCGVGEFLTLCAKDGWQTVGFEPSAIACEVAKCSGIEVVNNFFSSNLLTQTACKGKVDAIFMSNILDQVSDPLELLREVNKVLKDGGVILIRTPNITFNKILRLHRRNPRRNAPPQAKDTLYIFHPYTMKLLFQKVGGYKLSFLNSKPFVETQSQPVKRLLSSGVMFRVTNLLYWLTLRKVVITPSMLVVAVKQAR
ncbi:class I SAM-dependent methyltransferase [Chloroflexota bacterium]